MLGKVTPNLMASLGVHSGRSELRGISIRCWLLEGCQAVAERTRWVPGKERRSCWKQSCFTYDKKVGTVYMHLYAEERACHSGKGEQCRLCCNARHSVTGVSAEGIKTSFFFASTDCNFMHMHMYYYGTRQMWPQPSFSYVFCQEIHPRLHVKPRL